MTYQLFLSISRLLLLWFLLSLSAYAQETNKVTIGVTAQGDIQLALNKWQGTLELLQKKVPAYQFTLLPFSQYQQLSTAFSKGSLDFLISDPYTYLRLKERFKLQHFVSLINHRNQELATHYAGVIFTRADRSDINSLADINGKSIMGVGVDNLGGWLMALRELKNKAVAPQKILYSLNGQALEVFKAVLNGNVDVGTVRTGEIEKMLRAGIFSIDEIKIINRQTNNLAMPHSTRIYPEWSFAAAPQVKQELLRQVMVVLYSIGTNDKAAIDGDYTGWGSALDYAEVELLLNELNLKPFNQQSGISFSSLWKQHKWLLIIAFSGLLSLASFFLYLLWLNRKLKLSKIQLAKHQQELEEKVKERTFGLLEYHKFSQSIINGVNDPLMVVDMDLNVLTRNKAAQNWMSDEVSKLPDLRCYQLSHNRDRPCDDMNVPCPFLEVMMTGKPCSEIHEVEKDGKMVTLEVTATPLHDDQGELTGIVESFHDISQHMRLMRKLSRKEQYLSTVMDSAHDGIATIDAKARVLRVNKSIFNLLGYTPDELKGTDATQLLSPPDHKRYQRFRQKRNLHQLTRILKRHILEISARHKKGHLVYLEVRLGELVFEDEFQYLVVLRDISTRKKLQNELEKSRRQFYFQDKMASVGHIAAGIIHEIGNPAASLNALIEQLKEAQIEQNIQCDTCQAPMDQLIENIHRIGEILNEVSDFTQPQASELLLTDINHLVKNVASILKYEQTIQFLPLQLQLADDLPAVNAKAEQVSQVLMNILFNAIEACDQKTERNPEIILSTKHKKQRVYIAIKDNGIGMNADTLDKVFDVDYSTKQERNGHGLGLSICQSIVHQHGGEITIHSSLNKGTTVEFYLPSNEIF